jgi:eukaryotic-like serine/threonine-protein kinase
MQDSVPNTIGKFRILTLLGKGSQGAVYLATDPYLERQVAVKVPLRPSSSQKVPVRGPLQEARIVSKLHHPNIVQIYEAGEHEGRPYLVFEYVEGLSLRDLLKKQSSLSVPTAVNLIRQIIDGIACAHQQGVVHRDLSPANIMIAKNGSPRVMDFGISNLFGKKSASSELTGTIRYMSPEHFSDKPIGPASDVFSLGLIFYEMLVGAPAIDGENNFAIIYKVVHEPIPPPSQLNNKIEKKLDRFLMKALEKDPRVRYPDALAMKKALDACLAAEQSAEEPSPAREGVHSTVDFLLRRMKHKSDFPAFSKYLIEINKLASAESQASTSELANLILRDYSLTTKLLKLVNSAFYGSGDGITSVSQAVLVLGFEQVRIATTSLMLFTHLQKKSKSAALTDALLLSFMSGIMARDIAARLENFDKEEACICSMFRNLGKHLAIYYFAEEFAEIQDLMERRGIDEATAARTILGISYSELGLSVAASWKFPDKIIYAMRDSRDPGAEELNPDLEILRQLSMFSNELSHLASTTPREEKEEALIAVADPFRTAFRIPIEELASLVNLAIEKVRHYAEIVDISLARSKCMKSLMSWASDEGGDTMRVAFES